MGSVGFHQIVHHFDGKIAILSVKYDGVCNGGSPDGDFDAGMNTTLLYRLSLHDVCLIYFHISNTFTEGHVLYCAFKKTPPRFI